VKPAKLRERAIHVAAWATLPLLVLTTALVVGVTFLVAVILDDEKDETEREHLS
jgi:hypothetical protein